MRVSEMSGTMMEFVPDLTRLFETPSHSLVAPSLQVADPPVSVYIHCTFRGKSTHAILMLSTSRVTTNRSRSKDAFRWSKWNRLMDGMY